MVIQTLELDVNKVYSIMIEVGNMPKDLVIQKLQEVKALYESQGIKAVYSAMCDGVSAVTINEILPSVKEW